MSLVPPNPLAAAAAEQQTRDTTELHQLRAQVHQLRVQLAIAKRTARALADREATTRAWAERLEAEHGGRGGFEGRHVPPPRDRADVVFQAADREAAQAGAPVPRFGVMGLGAAVFGRRT